MFMKSLFHGRLTEDIDLKSSPNGHPVAHFSMACDRYAGAEKGNITEFPRFVAWRGIAERLSKHTAKGSELFIEGQYTSYKRKVEGEEHPRTIVEFEVLNFDFCGSKKSNEGGAPSGSSASSQAAPATPAAPAYSNNDFEELDGDDGDLPF